MLVCLEDFLAVLAPRRSTCVAIPQVFLNSFNENVAGSTHREKTSINVCTPKLCSQFGDQIEVKL